MDLFKSVAHYLKNTDLYLAVIAFICSGYGMALIYSATLNPVSIKDDGSTKNLYVQGAAILIGFGAFVLMSLIDLEGLRNRWKNFVIVNICLQLLAVHASRHGGQRPARVAQSGRDQPSAGRARQADLHLHDGGAYLRGRGVYQRAARSCGHRAAYAYHDGGGRRLLGRLGHGDSVFHDRGHYAVRGRSVAQMDRARRRRRGGERARCCGILC